MNKRHKHADVIHAWAEGAELEYLRDGEWVGQKNPSFHEALQWRVKPKTVKKEGWVNVYPANGTCSAVGTVFNSKEAADTYACDSRIHCIRIEWEETL
jgi:hypothetical protein